jgi:flagellar biosynthesis protein FlhF
MHTFRGRTMQECVARLKASLGPDAVIVKTDRGEDPRGRYVEITAFGPGEDPMAEFDSPPPPRRSQPQAQPQRQPQPQRRPEPRYDVADESAFDGPAMGGRIGAAAAYGRVARNAAPAMQAAPAPAPRGAGEQRTAAAAAAIQAVAQRLSAQQRGAGAEPNAASGPFVERAALLARQVAAPAVAADVQEKLRAEVGALREAISGLEQPSGVSPDEFHRALGALAAQLRDLRGAIAQGTESREAQRISPDVRVVRDRLCAVGVGGLHAADVGRRVAPHLVESTPDDAHVLGLIGRELSRDLTCSGDMMPAAGERRVLAFVGPTGVGKTTTIAKIAAQAQLMRGLKVGLVTVDTFRMAAVDQLARYAEILECPLEVVKDADALPEVLERMADCDLVLIDTTGRSPRDEDQVSALGRYFPAGWGGETVLTVALSTRERDLHHTVEAFARLDYTHLCVTKLDETDAIGGLYTVARRAGRPLAWTTSGQRVPEDLEIADAEVIAARIVAKSCEMRAWNEALAG